MNPIGMSEDGAVLFTATPGALRAADLFVQLEAWRARGYDPQLWGTPRGWTIVLDMTRWGLQEINERNNNMLLRFNTEVCATPQAAIEAALKVIQP